MACRCIKAGYQDLSSLRKATELYWPCTRFVPVDLQILGLMAAADGLPMLKTLTLYGTDAVQLEQLCEGLGRRALPRLTLLSLSKSGIGARGARALERPRASA